MKTSTIRKSLWIDRSKAVLVTADGESEAARTLVSDIRRNLRSTGVAPSIVSRQRSRRRLKHRLRRYYQTVADALAPVDALYLFGPGPAKLELKKFLATRADLRRVPVRIETTDSMTDNQIAAKSRPFLHPKAA